MFGNLSLLPASNKTSHKMKYYCENKKYYEITLPLLSLVQQLWNVVPNHPMVTRSKIKKQKEWEGRKQEWWFFADVMKTIVQYFQDECLKGAIFDTCYALQKVNALKQKYIDDMCRNETKHIK